MILENINWTSERELSNLDECEDLNYSETDFQITFDYNGIKLFTTLDFSINLYEYSEEEVGLDYVDVLDVDVTLKEMLDENDDEFKLTVQKEIELQNDLQIDLKTQY